MTAFTIQTLTAVDRNAAERSGAVVDHLRKTDLRRRKSDESMENRGE
jgi:hypothetical protein